MSTNEFARILLTWIKSFLSWIGIPRDRLNELDEIIFLILIVVIAFAVGAVFHYLSVRFTRKVLKYKNISFLSSLIEYNALRKMSAVIPPLIISALLPFAFDYRSTWFTVSEKITWIYFFIALLFSVNAVLNSVGNVLMNKEQLQNRPMKGFIQIFQVIFSCVAIIVIISILINKSPLNLITGLGAFAAVLMLIFKDTILGFVAGVLLTKNGDFRLKGYNQTNDRYFTKSTLTTQGIGLMYKKDFTNWRELFDWILLKRRSKRNSQ